MRTLYTLLLFLITCVAFAQTPRFEIGAEGGAGIVTPMLQFHSYYRPDVKDVYPAYNTGVMLRYL